MRLLIFRSDQLSIQFFFFLFHLNSPHFNLMPSEQTNKSEKTNNKKKQTKNHRKKLTNLRKQQESKINKSTITYITNTIHNFSSYRQTTEEYTALSYGLDRHTPCKFSKNRMCTEFEQFYQSISKDISHIPENDLSCLKIIFRNTYKIYSKMHVPY